MATTTMVTMVMMMAMMAMMIVMMMMTMTQIRRQEFKQHMEERQTFVRQSGHNYSVSSKSITAHYHHCRLFFYHDNVNDQAAYWMGETGTGSNDHDWAKIVRFLQVIDN